MGLVWVTGVLGSGKSTVARELRRRWLPSWDADDRGELALILGWSDTAADLYRSFGATLVDATMPLDQVIDAVLAATSHPTP